MFFEDELKTYCTVDADLRMGCMQFRNSFLQSTGIDPFEKITIASLCMEVYRRGFNLKTQLDESPSNDISLSEIIQLQPWDG